MKSRAYNILGIAALWLFAACGQQHQAEQTVKDFVETNMETAADISGRDFADLGTTRHLSDSIIEQLRQRGAAHFKSGITYPTAPKGDLYYLRMKYIYQGDTLQNTFYLDSTLNQVVAFK